MHCARRGAALRPSEATFEKTTVALRVFSSRYQPTLSKNDKQIVQVRMYIDYVDPCEHELQD